MTKPSLRLAALALAAALPFAAQAHRGWLLPSNTVLSGTEPWVTVDAAVSTDVFYFDHQPMRLDNLQVTAPDGSAATPENSATGRYRSTFDLKLAQKGTYRIASVSDTLFASFKAGSETKRVRGANAEALAKEVPAGAEDLRVTKMQNRQETFVTNGKPSLGALKPTGAGLELVPITHPNDLFAGEPASFTLTLDGKPAADVEVTLIRGGIRYRDKLGDLRLKTDAAGKFSVSWPEPGMYWVNASVGDSGRNAPGGTLAAPARRASYTATVEVQKP